MDIFKDTWNVSICFCCTISIHYRGEWSRYFEPNHDVLQTLNPTKAWAQRCDQNIFSGFAETYLANSESGDWVRCVAEDKDIRLCVISLSLFCNMHALHDLSYHISMVQQLAVVSCCSKLVCMRVCYSSVTPGGEMFYVRISTQTGVRTFTIAWQHRQLLWFLYVATSRWFRLNFFHFCLDTTLCRCSG